MLCMLRRPLSCSLLQMDHNDASWQLQNTGSAPQDAEVAAVRSAIVHTEGEISDVKTKIDGIETKIDGIETDLASAGAANDLEEVQYLRDEKRQLREELRQLRDKERQLRDKERQLRDKEQLLMQRQASAT